MDTNPTPRPTHLDGPDLDLYTIPRHSSWFRWDNIHEKERTSLKEFFDGSSITRTPKIYKEYRDFIINKYRENPSRALTFTQIRKCLIGDVTLLYKVFDFLNNWGIINFGVVVGDNNNNCNYHGASFCEEIGNVRVEDGAPNGVRVVATPGSLKPISVPKSRVGAGGWPRKGVNLVSYSDVFGLEERKRVSCGVCSASCEATRYEYTKGSYMMCESCFESGKFGEGKLKDDFELRHGVEESSNEEGVWSDEETLLLLESVMKHGSDWDLVAQHVRTKNKLECIAKLIELPLGDFILNSAHGLGNGSAANGNLGHSLEYPSSKLDPQEAAQGEEYHEMENENKQNGEDAEEGPPLKRKRIISLADGGCSLMKQISLISTMVDSDITAAAAEAAVATLCEETSCPREIFDDADVILANGLQSDRAGGSHGKEDSDVKEDPGQPETEELMRDDIPLTLRLRAAIATAFGATAARAKLLADQEDREMEHLVLTIIETQMKKLLCKIKHLDELEMVMEKEHVELEELKEHLIEERIDTLRKAIDAGVLKWKDGDSVRH